MIIIMIFNTSTSYNTNDQIMYPWTKKEKTSSRKPQNLGKCWNVEFEFQMDFCSATFQLVYILYHAYTCKLERRSVPKNTHKFSFHYFEDYFSDEIDLPVRYLIFFKILRTVGLYSRTRAFHFF
jgi:hypothetical protein